MSEFIVSARKYRPAVFDKVVGQKHITNTLKNAIKSGKVAHAFLFCGPRGVGKTTSARILAKMLNCLNPGPDLEPCNECESCNAFNTSHSFNIHELDAASNNSVDDIRSLVEQVRIPPQIGKYSVYIIDEVHMLSQSAFNAFLKTLEEPPAHAIFILATTEKHKILPTILSRCQVYDFSRITVEDSARHLANIAQEEGVSFEPDALHIIAQKADGALRDALSIFDRMVTFTGANLTYAEVIKNLNILDYDYFFKVTDLAYEGDYQSLLMLYNEILDKGFDGSHFNAGLAEHFRNLLVSRDVKTVKLLEVGETIKARYLEQGQKIEPAWLLEALKVSMKTDSEYRLAANKRLLIELMLLQTATLKKKLHSVNEDQGKKPDADADFFSAGTPASAPKPLGSAKVMATRPQTVSINPAKVLQQVKPDQNKQEQLETNTHTGQDQVFTEEEANAALSKYIESLSSSKKQNLYVTWTGSSYKFVGTTVHITVSSKILANLLEEEKADMLEMLRGVLNNKQVSLEVTIELPPEAPVQKILSNNERFELLAANNPVLQEMKKIFDLDTETPH